MPLYSPSRSLARLGPSKQADKRSWTTMSGWWISEQHQLGISPASLGQCIWHLWSWIWSLSVYLYIKASRTVWSPFYAPNLFVIFRTLDRELGFEFGMMVSLRTRCFPPSKLSVLNAWRASLPCQGLVKRLFSDFAAHKLTFRWRSPHLAARRLITDWWLMKKKRAPEPMRCHRF